MSNAPSYFRTDGWVKTPLGPAIPGAQVYVCTQPATTSTAPPFPLASLFADPFGQTPLSQPIYTDGFGHYDFYVAAGTYTLVVANSGGLIQQVYPDQSIGLSAAHILLTTSGVDNVNQNQLDISGSGNITVTPTSTGVVISSSGAAIPQTGTGNLLVSAFSGMSTAPSGEIPMCDGSGNIADSGINITNPTFFGTLTVPTVNATSGIQINGTAFAASNLSNGVTGSGAVVLAASPTISGTLSAASVSLTGGLALASGQAISWNSDTSLSRGQAGVVDVGTGAAGSAAGYINCAGVEIAGTAFAASNLSNGTTGSGAVMLTASPSTTGTLTAAAITASGTVTAAEVNAPVAVNAQTSGTSAYTAVLGDANQLVTMSDASASTFTVPQNSSVAFPVGTTLTVIQLGAGQITLTAGSGTTFHNPSSATTRAQYSTVSMVQVSANVWCLGGDLS